MKKGKTGLVLVIILILTAAAALGVCRYLGLLDKLPFEVIKNGNDIDIVPEGTPSVNWDNDDPEGSYKELVSHLRECEPEIAVLSQKENLQWEDICRECFWVESFRITETEGSSIKRYKFSYLPDAEDNMNMQEKIDAEVKDIISLVPKDGTDWDKVLAIHDELIKRITYDESEKTKHIHDIYGALVEHRAVCQGYTYSMTYICRRLGIGCEEVYSGTHIWSKFPGFDSDECYVDVTWDDIDKADSSGEPYITHDFFGLTRKEMESQSEHQPLNEAVEKKESIRTGDNYYRRKGRYIPEGENEVLELAIKEQFDSGQNVLQVRFDSEKDFRMAKDSIDRIIRDQGYSESYYTWQNDRLFIFSVGLNTSSEESA